MATTDSRDIMPFDIDTIERLVLHQCERCERDYPGFEIVLRPVRRHFIGRCGDCAQQYDIAPGDRLPARTSVIRKPLPPRPNVPTREVAAKIANRLEELRDPVNDGQQIAVGSDGEIGRTRYFGMSAPVRSWERSARLWRTQPWTPEAVIALFTGGRT
jgi:hypothetical protein